MMEAVTALGTLRGEALAGCTVFRGVPYARAGRFERPIPVEPWTGVRDCTQFSAACPQLPQPPGAFYEKEFYLGPGHWCEMSEDCLYLNVWTPAKQPDEQLPVAVWIHGGGYDHGFGHEVEFDGERWAARGVILVTINYRVGVFGFLSHPWLDDTANLGSLDQVAALRWVHDHIAAFGGNPDNVTVFGQSAGAISVQTLVSSPLAKGLFARAILHSGGGYGLGLLPARTLQDAQAIGEAFVRFCGLESKEALMEVPAAFLVERYGAYRQAHPQDGLLFVPILDGSFLRETLDESAANGSVQAIPYMIGATLNDLLNTANTRPLQEAAARWATQMEHLGSRPTWVYDFRRKLPGDDAGAFHSAELWYVFGTLERCWRPMTEADHALSARMLDSWTRFCRTGDPGWPQWTQNAPYEKIWDI